MRCVAGLAIDFLQSKERLQRRYGSFASDVLKAFQDCRPMVVVPHQHRQKRVQTLRIPRGRNSAQRLTMIPVLEPGDGLIGLVPQQISPARDGLGKARHVPKQGVHLSELR